MPLFDQSKTLFSDNQINTQVDRICRQDLPKKLAHLLKFLIRNLREGGVYAETSHQSPSLAKQHVTARQILLIFEREEFPKQTLEALAGTHTKAWEIAAYDRARKDVGRLAEALQKYYRELSDDSSDRIRITIPLHGKSGAEVADLRYQPQLSPFSAKSSRSADFRVVGNNLDALKYVNQQIPKLNRLEETFIRWVDRKSLYPANIVSEFLKRLKGSRLLYRAVIAPLSDPIVFKLKKEWRDVADRALDTESEGIKFFKLIHSAPIMNFTLLYYFEEPSDFYRKTDDVEVLFGYGVHSQHGDVEDTVVFSSKHPDLVLEFARLFNVLKSEDFSRQIAIDRSDLFLSESQQCDVLATFIHFPEDQIIRNFRACNANSHIKICITAWHLLDRSFYTELQSALKKKVKVSIAVWKPDSPFLTARQNVIEPDSDAVTHEVGANRDAMLRLRAFDNFYPSWCTGELGSVSIFWIDDLIYFSPYWVGMNVSEGPHFLVDAASRTGEKLKEQYHMMLETAVTEL